MRDETPDSGGGDAASVARRYERLLENAADVTLVLDASGRLTYASPSAGRVLGYAPDANLGESVFALIHPDDRARVLESFRSAQAEPGAHPFIPFRVRHGDGSWRDVEAASNVLLDDPAVGGIVVNLRDVTDRKRAEDERGALLALLSHDLRTPLAAIVGRAQLLHRRLGGRGTTAPDALREDAAVIERTARRMDAMLDELVDLARLGQGEPLVLSLAAVDLAALVARLVDERRELSPDHPIHLDATVGPLVGTFDEVRLARAVANVLSNAAKYSAPGSPIVVRLGRPVADGASLALLTVEDRGIGIPAADLARAGERFFRAANAIRRAEGTGLGLFGVRRIVEQHGGDVAIESEERSGTRVTVRLPLIEPGHAGR